jgi:hypothetical protein
MAIFKLIGGVLFNVAIFGGLLFLPAGTLKWWRAWVLLGVVFVGTVASTVSICRVNKGLLEERCKPPLQKGQPLADKIVVVLLMVTFLGVLVFIPLDVFRLHLIAKPGPSLSRCYFLRPSRSTTLWTMSRPLPRSLAMRPTMGLNGACSRTA